MKKSIAFIFLLSCLEARQPYHAKATAAGETTSLSASNLIDFTHELNTESLQSKIPSYTSTSAVAFAINLRGLDAVASYANGSTTLNLQIPEAGISQSFTGSTREESNELLEEYLRTNAHNHHEILKAYAKYTPIDPIAGNPNSLLAQMAQADFLLSRLYPLSGCDGAWSSQPMLHRFQVGASAGRAFAGGFETSAFALPLQYSYAPTRSWAVIIDLPLAVNKNGGAYSYLSSLALGLRIPISHYWSLTPTVRAGIGGSFAMTTGGGFWSAGITNAFDIKLAKSVLSIIDYVGYFKSMRLQLGGVNCNYDLQNRIYKNGIVWTTCQAFHLGQSPLNFSFSFLNTVTKGSDLYIENFNEAGVSLIMSRLIPTLDDSLSLGFSYQFGQKRYRGYFLNLIYNF